VRVKCGQYRTVTEDDYVELSEKGKCTYREVGAQRFDSSALTSNRLANKPHIKTQQ
jgi:hypothetical protein